MGDAITFWIIFCFLLKLYFQCCTATSDGLTYVYACMLHQNTYMHVRYSYFAHFTHPCRKHDDLALSMFKTIECKKILNSSNPVLAQKFTSKTSNRYKRLWILLQVILHSWKTISQTKVGFKECINSTLSSIPTWHICTEINISPFLLQASMQSQTYKFHIGIRKK